ncbi:MAG: hypothetical protein HGA23_01900 [Bacteroidales bacterium]|nr:hypothetical protein [Bacteroidales bacterium]
MSQEKEIKSTSHLKLPGKEFFSWKNLGRSLHSLLDGTFLTKGRFRRAMPFIIFLMILGVIYISNIFKVEKTKRQIDNLEEDLRELRYEYITSRSKLMDESKPSKIVTKLKDTGIGETLDPPKKIIISPETKEK